MMYSNFQAIGWGVICSITLILLITIWYKKRNKNLSKPKTRFDFFVTKGETPYQITIKNNGDSPEIVTLFDKNKLKEKNNFGHSENIELLSVGDITYEHLLNMISDKEINGSSLIRIQTSNPSQLLQELLLKSSSPHGEISFQLITQSYFSVNQFQNTILDIPIDITVDNDFGIELNMLPKSSYTLTIFPSECKNDKSSFIRLVEWHLNTRNKRLQIVDLKNDFSKPKKLALKNTFEKMKSLLSKK